jgi:hypothetical protein
MKTVAIIMGYVLVLGLGLAINYAWFGMTPGLRWLLSLLTSQG